MVKFKKANGRYQPGEVATFSAEHELELVKQGYAVVHSFEEADVSEKEKRDPTKPTNRQTTVGPQKR